MRIMMLVLLLSMSFLCGETSIPVITTIGPYKTFVQWVGGNRVSVNRLIPSGASPAVYEPTMADLRRISVATLYVMTGHLPFEEVNLKRLRVLNPTMTLLDCSKEIQLMPFEKNHSHHHHQEEQVGDNDPHVWLDPLIVSQQLDVIQEALCELEPRSCSQFIENKQFYQRKLADLDEWTRQMMARSHIKHVFVYHPVLGYFGRRYGIEQVPLEYEGKTPTIRYLKSLLNTMNEEKVSRLFVQPQFLGLLDESYMNRLGINLEYIDPLSEDYFVTFKGFINRLTRRPKD